MSLGRSVAFFHPFSLSFHDWHFLSSRGFPALLAYAGFPLRAEEPVSACRICRETPAAGRQANPSASRRSGWARITQPLQGGFRLIGGKKPPELLGRFTHTSRTYRAEPCERRKTARNKLPWDIATRRRNGGKCVVFANSPGRCSPMRAATLSRLSPCHASGGLFGVEVVPAGFASQGRETLGGA